jgi:hypothetical protein
MKKLISTLVLSGLISAGLLTPSSGKSQPPASISIVDVLQAHNVSQHSGILEASITEARKLTWYYSDSERDSPGFFERKVLVSNQGNAFKRYTVDPRGLREQFALFDGQAAYQAVVEEGKPVEQVTEMADSRLAAIKFSVITFGLILLLKQISDPATETLYLGQSARNEDMFQVNSATGSWILYADQSHKISKVEMGGKTVVYGDYRSVDEVQLPYFQALSVGNRLIYELVIDRIDLNPAFSAGHFSREALSKEIAL